MKLPNGSGSTRTLRRPGKPDRYQALGPRLASGTRPSLGVYDRREDADAVRVAGVRQLLEEAGGARLRGATLRAEGERYLEGRELDAPRSVGTERKAWRKICAAPWIDDPIDLIRTPALQAWLTAFAHRLPGTAPGVRAVLSGIFGAAGRAGHLEANPMASVKLPRRVRTHDPWTYLTLEEQRALLTAPIPEADRLLLTVWLYTGLRAGEIFALRIADVHVARAAIVVRYGSLHGPPKGRRIRTVHLFPAAVEALRRWLELLPGYLEGNPNRFGLVFPGPRGGARQVGCAWRRDTWKGGVRVGRVDGWQEALELAGIVPEFRHDGRPVRNHDLRHSCGTSLLCGWWGERWRMEDVQKHLGHAKIKETERYAHLAPGVISGLAARTVGVGHGLVTAPTPIAAKQRPIALASVATDSSPGRSGILGADRAPCPTGNPPAAIDLARAALEAVAAGDPHRERRCVEALEAVLAEDAARVAQPQRGRR